VTWSSACTWSGNPTRSRSSSARAWATLCDAIAERISAQLCRHYLERFSITTSTRSCFDELRADLLAGRIALF